VSDIQDNTKATHEETLKQNRLGYTQHELDCAKQGQEFYHTIGTPTIKALKDMLRTNQIRNCPATSDDLKLAKRIYGQSVSSLKGKSTCQKPKVVTTENIKIPKGILERYQQGLLTSIDQKIKFQCLVPMNSKQHSEYHRALDVILRKYNLAGFHITRIHCDGEFKPMMEEIQDELDITMKYASKDEHVPEAK